MGYLRRVNVENSRPVNNVTFLFLLVIHYEWLFILLPCLHSHAPSFKVFFYFIVDCEDKLFPRLNSIIQVSAW